MANEAEPDLTPFGSLLDASRYAGLWIPIAVVDGAADAVGISFLVRPPGADVLTNTDWPASLGFAGPVVNLPFSAGAAHEGHLWPHCEREGFRFEPFVVLFEPMGAPTWMEPIQPYLLYWRAWPKRDGDEVRWWRENEDGEPEEIARWVGSANEPGRRLELRRDKLLAFLAAFDFDLAIYVLAHTYDGAAKPRPVHEMSAGRWNARVWTTNGGSEGTLVTARSVLHLAHPAYDEDAQPWSHPAPETPVTFLVGIDANTGKERRAAHPPDDFLTPVFFDRRVLEPYYEDPKSYGIRDGVVRGRSWYVPIAITAGGLVHAWLGDLNVLPHRAKLHWSAHAVVAEETVPPERIARDFLAMHMPSIERGVAAPLLALIEEINAAATERWGEPLYDAPDERHRDRVRVLRSPANDSWPAFQEQVLTLAVWLVDHLRAAGLQAAGAPKKDKDGLIHRTAALCAALRNIPIDEARAGLGGLYAVQNVRSDVAAHRTGVKARATLERAGISDESLRAGFDKLARLATDALVFVRDSLRASPPPSAGA